MATAVQNALEVYINCSYAKISYVLCYALLVICRWIGHSLFSHLETMITSHYRGNIKRIKEFSFVNPFEFNKA